MMTVLLAFLVNLLKNDTMIYEVRESSPEVGSSRKITCGSESNSNAILVRFF